MATTLSSDRNTIRRDGKEYYYPVAAITTLYKGGAVVLDSAGNAIAPTATTGLVSVGICAEDVDNSSGLAAAKNVTVRTGIFRFDNHGAITKASIGDLVYFYNDVAVQADGTGVSPAGRMVDLDSTGVWVELFYAPAASASYLLAANNLSDVGTVATATHSLGLGTADSPTFTGVTTTGAAVVGTTATVTGILKADGGVATTAAAPLAIGAATTTVVNIGATANPIAVTCATGAAAFPVGITVGTTVAAKTAITGSRYTAVVAVDTTATTPDVYGNGIVQCATDGKKLNLPNAAAANKGMTLTLQNTGTTTACGPLVVPDSSDYIKGTIGSVHMTAAAGKGIVNTSATNYCGDYATLMSDGTDTWWIIGGVGTWAGNQ